MSDGDEVDDALSFLDREPAKVSPGRAKVSKKTTGMGKWLARGVFLSMHAVIALTVLNWVGILHTPGFDRLRARLHQATAPEVGEPVDPRGVVPTGNGPGAARPPVVMPSTTHVAKPRATPSTSPPVNRVQRTSKGAVAKAEPPDSTAKTRQTLAEKRGVVVEDPGDQGFPPPEKGARTPREGIEERRGRPAPVEELRLSIEEKLRAHVACKERAKPVLLAKFGTVIERVRANREMQAADKARLLEMLKAEKDRFESQGTVPTTEVMVDALIPYQKALNATRRPLILAYERLINALIQSHGEAETAELVAKQKMLDEETAMVTGFAPRSVWKGDGFKTIIQDAGGMREGGMNMELRVLSCEGDEFTGEMRFANGSIARVVGKFNGIGIKIKSRGMIRDVGSDRAFYIEGGILGYRLQADIDEVDTVTNGARIGEKTHIRGSYVHSLVRGD